MAPKPLATLGARLEGEAAWQYFERSAGKTMPRDDARLAEILAFADGVPLALAAAARAIALLGMDATRRAPAQTILGEGELRERLSAVALELGESVGLAELLSAFDGAVSSASIIGETQLTIPAVEALTVRGCLVREGEPDGDLAFRLVRPAVALFRERGLPSWSIATHARTTSRLAAEALTQFEITGELEPLRRGVDDIRLLVDRALVDDSLVDQALEAVRALAPLVCFDRADDGIFGSMRQLIQHADRLRLTSLAFGRGALALALAERARGNQELASERLGRSEEIGRLHADRALEGRVARLKGAISIDAGRMDDAILDLERAVEASEEGGDDVHRTLALQWLALALGRSGKLEAAIRALRETTEVHRAFGNARMVLFEQAMLGSFYAQAGDLRRGRIAIEEAVALARRIGDTAALGFALASLAYSLIAERDCGRAIDTARQAEDCFATAGQGALVAYCRGVRAIAHLVAGEIDRAVEPLEHAAARAKETERPLFLAYLATIEARDGLIAQAHARITAARAVMRGNAGGIEDAVVTLAGAVEQLGDPRARPLSAGGSSVDARIARIWLERLELPVHRELSLPPPSSLLIRRDGAAFSRQGIVMRIGSKPVMRRLVEALAAHRLAAPGEPLEITTLTTMVWPGERMLERSARTRLHAVVLRLRQLGLRGALNQSDGGYWLDPMETEVVDQLEEIAANLA